MSVYLPGWALALIMLWFTVWSVLGPWIGVRICRAHWQCPINQRQRVEEWQAGLERARAKT